MPTRSRAPFLPFAVATALVLAACGSDDDATDTTATTQAPTTEAPPDTGSPATEPTATEPPTTEPTTGPPAELAPIESVGFGEYAVGVTTITIDADTERPLTVDVWFPLRPLGADEGQRPAHRYTLLEGNYYESPFAVTADPAEISPDGPFPLVVYSHGSGGVRYVASYYTEAIASHGYVVAAPDHTGNTALEAILGRPDEFEQIAVDRPRDVEHVIDALTDPSHPAAGALASTVDAERVAVTGHSFGGFTSYAVASGFANDLGRVAADPRVDAIVPLAPATGDGDGRLLTDDDLAAITVPALVIGGTSDEVTPIDPNVTRPWELSNSSPHFRLDLLDAGHYSFTDACEYQEFLPTLDPPALDAIVEVVEGYAAQACTDAYMPIDRAQDLTNTFAIAFLDSVFDDGVMFTPDTHEIPDDVEYLAAP